MAANETTCAAYKGLFHSYPYHMIYVLDKSANRLPYGGGRSDYYNGCTGSLHRRGGPPALPACILALARRDSVAHNRIATYHHRSRRFAAGKSSPRAIGL